MSTNFNDFKCNSCAHYNYENHKCTNNKCHAVGNEKDIYKEYEIASESELSHREMLYEFKLNNQKESKKWYYNITSIAFIISSILSSIEGCYIFIVGIVKMFTNPEMTRTQLMLWSFREHSVANALLTLSVLVWILCIFVSTRKG